MGVSLPYGVGMLDLEDFGIIFHNFLSFNEKMMMGSYLDAYPKIITWTNKLFCVPPMEVRSGLIMVSFRMCRIGCEVGVMGQFH
jgi:hypothetical protein